MAYPEIQIDKSLSCVTVHNEDGSYKQSHSVESIIMAKILFELEKLSITIEELNGKIR